jgi:general nucleoside transport system ATP-binding protein
MQPRLQLTHITKRYPAVVANDDVSLTVQPGEIHAVLGENGAGKSTLMKIIFGSVKPDAGEMKWNGEPITIANPHAARKLGISMVFQHFSLFETLTVEENIALGLSPAEVKAFAGKLGEAIAQTGERYGLPLEAQRPVHTLSVGERQRVEIVRALLSHPKLLILDEPTSVLTPQAVQKLFVTLRKLSDEGCSILYISHKLDEIRALCHTATVMRGGKVTGVCDPRKESTQSLSRMMIGAAPHIPQRPSVARGEVRLSLRNLSLKKTHPFGTDLHAISLDVHGGEIVGIAGVSGNGQQELIAAISGETPLADARALMIERVPAAQFDAKARRSLGLAFVPEERLGRGAVPTLPLSENTLLSHQIAPQVQNGLIQKQSTRDLAARIIERFGVKAGGARSVAKSLSGGNLQKFIVGRELLREPRILLIAQPTWGVDVGAAAQIHSELLALKARGCAILMVSEEIDELFALCDRLHVIAKGALSPSVDIGDAEVEHIGLWMSGLWPNGPAAQATDSPQRATA